MSAGSDVDSSNNTASDPTTVVVVPDLTVIKTHTGSFLQGQVGATYSLTVANVGSGPTSSPVTISDSLPARPDADGGGRAGWVCNIAGQAVTCSRGDALNGGASYPAIALTVNVAPAAPPSLTNTAMVSGGGEINTSNNTADDITTIGPGPDLTVTKSHSGDFRQGQIGATFTITVSNPGFTVRRGIVTVTDTVPTGLLPTSASGAGWICTIAGQDVTCTRSDPLPSGTELPGDHLDRQRAIAGNRLSDQCRRRFRRRGRQSDEQLGTRHRPDRSRGRPDHHQDAIPAISFRGRPGPTRVTVTNAGVGTDHEHGHGARSRSPRPDPDGRGRCGLDAAPSALRASAAREATRWRRERAIRRSPSR